VGGGDVAKDSIEREMMLNVPPEQVWVALTDPVHVAKWFGTEGEIDLRPGGAIYFGWPGFGRFYGVVVEADRPRKFSYRWCLDRDTPVDEGATTLVEFTLEKAAGGTRLLLVESGFASLPEGVRDRHLADNTRGWEEELAKLAKHIEAEAGS
jgi:uncharacterized protein YndB with AHSA1/START domain